MSFMFNRTLNGANMIDATSLNLPANVNALRINGDFGTAGQVIAKDSNNRLNWSRVDEVEIPDNSISGNKLKNDITFSTTSLIRANEFFSNYFIVGQFGAQNVVLDDDGLIMSGNRRIEASDSFMNINNITIKGIGVEPSLDIEAGGIDFEGDINSVNGGITLTNGDITLTNGTLFANVEGTITEEVIECNKLIIRNADPPIASPIVEIQDAIAFRMLNISDIQIFNIDGSTGDISVAGDISSSGNYSSTDGDITLTNGLLTANDISFTTSITSTDGDITLTNGLLTANDISFTTALTSTDGDITLTNGDLSCNDITSNDITCNDITCNDITITNHTGFTDVRADNIELPRTGTILIDLEGSTGDITTAGKITMSGVGKDFTLKGGISMGGNLTSLNGNITLTNGLLTADDINVLNHTGTISFNNILTDQIGFPKSGVSDVYINQNGITMEGAETFNCDGAFMEIKNILAYGNTGFQSSTLICLGGLTTGDDSGGNDGSILMNTGDITLTTGDITLTAGDITLSKAGVSPPPTDNTYTDWAINISNSNGHQHIGGNLIVDGTIYANVEGTITEEEVDCQRLTLRSASPPIAGITGMIMGTGSKITNDIAGTNELTMTANTGDIVCNTFQSKGNTQLGYNSATTTTIGRFGISNQALVCECQNIDLGSSSGIQATNVLNYRGGLHTFTGEKVVIGDYLGFSLVDCSLEGINNIYQNKYTNAFSYFNMNGALNTHSLTGTIQQYRILRSASQRQQLVAYTSPFTNSSTTYTTITGFSFVNIICVTSVAKITLEYLFRKSKGNPDLYCRIDDTLGGASAYASQIGGPALLVNTNHTGELRKSYSFFITGLPQGFQKSFYPKFADTTSASNNGYLMYGSSFSDMTMTIEFLQPFDGDISDPLAPSGL
jgi:hypothetical protein